MKRLLFACLLTPALLAAAPATPTPDLFSDKICPNATGPVRELNAEIANPETLIDRAIATARHVIEAYKICGDDMASAAASGVNPANAVTTGVEGQHLTQVRQAQFYVLIARLQRLSGYPNSAHDSLQTALDLVKTTLDWRAPSQTYYRSNNVNVGSGSSRTASIDSSAYRQNAIDIRDAALAELKLLPKSAGGTADAK
jgi:hypothetical protein